MATRYIGDNNAQMYSNLLPAGTVLPFAGATAPTGWLLCDGTSYNRADYQALFNTISTAHGSASGTTFNVPDYRGRFLRGVDGAANRDPDKASRAAAATGGNTGNTVGSVQTGQTAAHSHELKFQGGLGGDRKMYGDYVGGAGTSIFISNFTAYSASAVGGPAIAENAGGNETRPVNANVNFIIKY